MIRPPWAAFSPSQVVTTPPAPSMIGHERDDIVGFEIGLDHEVDEARRERAIGVTVAPVAREPDLPFDPHIGRPVGIVPNQERARRRERRLAKRSAGARVQVRVAHSDGGASPCEGASVRALARLPSP